MAYEQMTAEMSGRVGFIAALDQSGGSTPGALRLYGIPDTAYSGDAEMFWLMHQMRPRIMTAHAFTGAKVIAAILFEGTMDGEVRGKPTPAFLWEERGVIPFYARRWRCLRGCRGDRARDKSSRVRGSRKSDRLCGLIPR